MKQFIKTLNITLFAAAVALCGIMLSSCKKEYVDKFNIIPGDTVRVSGLKQIISFSLKEFSADTLIKASITDKDSIFVYWPVYKQIPTEITPEIIISNKAVISPASGVTVPFETDTKYKVTAEDGTERIYTLKVIPKQQPFVLAYGADGGIYSKTANIILAGYGHVSDINKTTVILETLDKSHSYMADVNRVNATSIRFKASAETPAGQYLCKVISGYATGYVGDGAILTLQ